MFDNRAESKGQEQELTMPKGNGSICEAATESGYRDDLKTSSIDTGAMAIYAHQLSLISCIVLNYHDVSCCDDLVPLATYKEYLQMRWHNTKNPELADFIVNLSDSGTMHEFDAEIRAFNDQLEEFKQRRDVESALSKLNKIHQICFRMRGSSELESVSLSPLDWYELCSWHCLIGHCLDIDSSNLYFYQMWVAERGDCARLEPMETYDEYLRRKWPRADSVINLSDPQTRREFNAAIREFNDKLPELKKHNDTENASSIINKIHKICYRYRPGQDF